MELNKWDRLLLITVLLALAVNIAASFFASLQNGVVQRYIGIAVVVIVVFWTISLVWRYSVNKITEGKYAVEAFILNGNKELLVYRHPYHNKFIPPGGRVRSNEFPEEALGKRLLERTGLSQDSYSFSQAFHPTLSTQYALGSVERVQVPFIIQKEIRRQRFFKRFHYDFIYVLQLKDNTFTFPSNKYAPFSFVTFTMLEQMLARRETFPDVLDAYEKILGKQ